MEGRKKTRSVMETEPFVLSLPRTLPTQPISITGCSSQAWEQNLAAFSAGSINSRLWLPVPYSSLCLLCSCCTSGRRTVGKTGPASISKARTEVLGWGGRGGETRRSRHCSVTWATARGRETATPPRCCFQTVLTLL